MKTKSKIRSILAAVLAVCLMLQMVVGLNITAFAADPALSVTNLEVESSVNPLGIDNTTPNFSWKIDSSERGVTQKSYHIQVATSQENLKNGPYVWDSNVVESDQSVNIVYNGEALQPTTRYFWQVTVTDNKGNTATSSEEAYWETGLMETNWSAKWIELDEGAQPSPANYSVEMDFRILKDDIGIIFAAKDTSNFLMWQVNTFEKKFNGKTSFRPHQWVNNAASCIDEKSIDDVIPVEDQQKQHHIKIQVEGNQITTWIDDTQVDQRTSDLAAYGKIGFRQVTNAGDCDEHGSFDNIVVKDTDTDDVLFSENFDNGNRSFNFGTVNNGELEVYNTLGLQKDSMSSAPMYRKEFDVNKEIKKATIHASALGIYELEVNGQKVSDDYFNPGWTNYELNQDDNNYVMYQTFDVTDLLQQGKNVIGAMTGHGWYSGKLFVGGNNRYGTGSKLLCQVEVEYADGEKAIVAATDSSWKINGNGPIIEDDFQGGESYDANLEIPGWSTTAYTEDSSWYSAKESSYNGDIVAQMGPTVKAIQEFKPIEVTNPSEGTYIFDLGQNIAGFARLHVKGEAGTTVKLRFGEMLNQDGTLYTDNLRSAKATDYYTLKGDENGETYEPRFTFHGFRYIEVTGYPGVPTAEDITGIALSSLQETTGTFTTSNEWVNQLQSNITWGQRDNFISVPTDCPQRDERLGYTGDGQVFVRTASMNMDVNQFFVKFMEDVISNQRADGAVADWTPNYVTPGDGMSGSFGNSGWGDAVVIIPWTMYTTYGNTDIIRQSYDGMKKWVDRYNTMGGDSHILPSSCSAYGDWLSINADTPKEVIGTGYFAYCANLLSKMAEVIGETEDAAYYHNLFLEVRDAFNKEFVDAEGHVKGQTQTSYLVALKFDLLPTEEARQKAADYLVADIKAKDWHLSTGFIGVAYLCPMLTEMGYSDVAYRLLLQDTYPSWLYSVKAGATTIWERWNSYNSETGQFGDVGMNSFNHYSLGSVGEWFYNYVGGIKYDETNPGYKNVTINPYQGGDLEFANTSYETPYGTIISNWKYVDNNTLQMDVQVPANSTATIYVPTEDGGIDNITENGAAIAESEGVEFVGMDDNKAMFKVGSGNYTIQTKVTREYLLNIADSNTAAASYVSINGGEMQKLPISEPVKAGDEITLKVTPVNDVDYQFSSISGAVESDKNEVTFTIEGTTNVTVTNSEIERVDLALNKTVNSSPSINNTDWNNKYLTDGNKISTTGSMGYTSTSTTTPDVNHWVEIDLGANTEFNRIHIYPRTDVKTADGKTPSFPKDFTIQVKADGASEYTTIGTYNDYTAPEGKPAVLTFDELQNARYIRLNVTRVGDPPAGEPYYLQLAEMGIYNEVETPEPPEVDKTALETLYNQVKDTDLSQYVDGDAKDTFVAELEKAKNLIANEEATQEQVNEAVTALQNAYDALEKKPVEPVETNKDILNKVIVYAEEQKASDDFNNVIADVQESFNAALDAAKEIAADPAATQDAIDAAWKALMTEIHKLGFVKGDITSLEALVSLAEGYDMNDYVEAGQAEFQAALKAAQDLLADKDNAMQAEIETAETNLLNAMLNLRYKADKSILEKVIAEANGS